VIACEQCLQSLVSKNCLSPHQFVCLQLLTACAQSCCFRPSCVSNTYDEMYLVHCVEVQMYLYSTCICMQTVLKAVQTAIGAYVRAQSSSQVRRVLIDSSDTDISDTALRGREVQTWPVPVRCSICCSLHQAGDTQHGDSASQ